MRVTLQLLVVLVVGFLQPGTWGTAEQIGETRAALPGVSFVEGEHASFLRQQSISSLRVYAFHNGTPVPIPFQVDERDRRDRWVLDHTEGQPQRSLSAEFGDNHFLVVMNRDLGHRGDLSQLPAGAAAWGEMRVGDEANALGFAYVGIFADPPALACAATCAYARYDPQTDRVYAERYALEFRGPLPSHVAFVDQLGEFGANTIAGVRASGEVRFLGGLLKLRRTEADIHTEDVSYRQGPLRAIRRARYWIPLPLGLRTTGRVDLLFYRDFVEGTAMVKLKVPPRLVLADGELLTYFDFLHLHGARLLLDGVLPSESASVNGHMTPAEQAVVGHPARWAALLLPDGRTVWVVVRLEGALQRLDQRLHFADMTKANGEVGGLPLIGFEFTGINRLETGVHRLSVFAGILDSVAPEEIQRTVNIFLSPPAVSIRELTR
ncbi:MAG: hypothetical protein ACRERD_07575 [Candidatus Binatia bacterium]